MRLNSIFTKISIVFIFSLGLLVALFIFYLKIEKEQQNAPIYSYHKGVAQTIKKNQLEPEALVDYMATANFDLEYEHRTILPNAEILFVHRGFETLYLDEQIYIHILTPRFRMLFKDLNYYEKSSSLYFLFLAFFIILVGFYIWLIKSLLPLKNLKESILEFSKGNMKVDCKSNQKDEIGQVANEFDNAARKIELLLESRQLFLRTVMHELKTPIAKGRIVSELIDDEKQSKRMSTIFEKLDFLINDFAKVEQVVSKNYIVQKHKYFLNDVISNGKNMLMLDNIDSKIELDIDENKKLSCDLDFLSLVFKNLIDNAFRYSEDGKVKIEQKSNEILFISKGKILEKPFKEYLSPFHNTTKSKNHGMGLGLYIVNSILDMHGMEFEYEYENGENVFIIVF